MRRYLVVAHKTLGGEHLIEHLRARRAEHNCQFHLVVPVVHPTDHAWTDGEVEGEAQERLDEILELLAEMGIGATGEVGDNNPVYAVRTAMRHQGPSTVDGIIVSTLPRSISAWWRRDVPKQIERAFPAIPMTHVEAAPVRTG
jgi:hypothetical protein